MARLRVAAILGISVFCWQSLRHQLRRKAIVAHGSSDLPVWGPIFGGLENGSEMAVQKRIKDACDYLAAISEKQS